MSLIVAAYNYRAESESRSRLAGSLRDVPLLVLLVRSLSVQAPNANSIDSKIPAVIASIANSLDSGADVTSRYSFYFKECSVPLGILRPSDLHTP